MDRHYETACIINPDIGEEAIKATVQKIISLVEKHNGKDVEVDEWGRRRLAYPIQKKKEGYYVIFTYTSPSEASKELERMLKFNEDIMRFQTVKLTKRVAKEAVAEEASAEAGTESSEDKEGGENE